MPKPVCSALLASVNPGTLTPEVPVVVLVVVHVVVVHVVVPVDVPVVVPCWVILGITTMAMSKAMKAMRAAHSQTPCAGIGLAKFDIPVTA